MSKLIACYLLMLTFLFNLAYAAPSQIILLRHADKLVQQETGPALSSKGYVRSLKFANYFLNKFGEPDFVIAGKPKGEDSSIRELQTVAPLVNILADRHPKKGFNILHPYMHNEYELLANHVLTSNKFKNKLVLICWRHTKIVELAKSLGVKEKLEPWPDDDYDSVYVIQYNTDGKISRFSHLRHQYPLAYNISWNDLFNRFADL